MEETLNKVFKIRRSERVCSIRGLSNFWSYIIFLLLLLKQVALTKYQSLKYRFPTQSICRPYEMFTWYLKGDLNLWMQICIRSDFLLLENYCLDKYPRTLTYYTFIQMQILLISSQSSSNLLSIESRQKLICEKSRQVPHSEHKL